MKHDIFFRTHPIFTREELTEHLSSHGNVGSRAQEALLTYYRKTKRLLPIRRGLYAVVPPGADPASYPVDPFLVAAKLTRDAVLSHHTALNFHGRAYSVHEHFTYTAARPLPPINFRTYHFRGVKSSGALLRVGKEQVGVTIADRAGINIRVTTLERALVDLLHRTTPSGRWEEIWRSLESIEFFDIDQVVEYTLLLGNTTTASRVGYFLDQHREALMIDDTHLQPLHTLRPRQPRYLDRSKRATGRLVCEWNLVVPKEVAERSWSEVL
jgi:predicted transcriptional regulator of viral defense system